MLNPTKECECDEYQVVRDLYERDDGLVARPPCPIPHHDIIDDEMKDSYTYNGG